MNLSFEEWRRRRGVKDGPTDKFCGNCYFAWDGRAVWRPCMFCARRLGDPLDLLKYPTWDLWSERDD